MLYNDKMSIRERDKYFRKMQKRYRKADRHIRGKLLDEMQAVTASKRSQPISALCICMEIFSHP